MSTLDYTFGAYSAVSPAIGQFFRVSSVALNRTWRTRRVVTMILGVVLAATSFSQVSLQITSVTPVGADNVKPPKLGDPLYGLKVTWNVTGHPQPFRILFQIANQTISFNQNTGPGTYVSIADLSMALDGSIPYTVTLDPDRTSGDTSSLNHVRSGQFVPTPPIKAVNYFDWRLLRGQQSMSFSIQGSIDKLVTYFARPASCSNQVIPFYGASNNSTFYTAAPFSQVLTRTIATKLSNTSVTVSQGFTALAANCRINQGLITDSWASLQSVPPAIWQFTQAEDVLQSDDSEIIAYAHKYLPSDYESTLKPIEAARLIFKGVEKDLSYLEPSPPSALDVLHAGYGDCGGMSSLYVAALRAIGIPARIVTGWLTGSDQWHCWSELYLPSTGWIPQDVTFGHSAASDGSFAYYFGILPTGNERIGVSRATTYAVPEISWNGGLQVGAFGWWYSHGNPSLEITCHCSLGN